MDLIAVTGVNFFLHRRRKYRYLVFASGLSSLAGLILLLIVQNYLLYCLIAHFLLNTCMVLVCFGWTGRREFVENWAVTYLVIILLGGILEWLTGSGILPQNLVAEILAGALCVYGVLVYLLYRRQFGMHLIRAELCKDGRRMQIMAYWDSGNQLRDPYTGQCISILSHGRASEFFTAEMDRFRPVPYRSLGEQSGMLWVTDVEELRLYEGKSCVRHVHAAIGIAQPGLMEDKAYDIILHSALHTLRGQ